MYGEWLLDVQGQWVFNSAEVMGVILLRAGELCAAPPAGALAGPASFPVMETGSIMVVGRLSTVSPSLLADPALFTHDASLQIRDCVPLVSLY